MAGHQTGGMYWLKHCLEGWVGFLDRCLRCSWGCMEYFDKEGSVPIPRTKADSDGDAFHISRLALSSKKTAKERLRNFILYNMDKISRLEAGYMVYYAVAP